jgi:ribonuclease Z
MSAQQILLTHFSARYPKVPPAIIRTVTGTGASANEDVTGKKGPTIALAFDHAEMKLGEMWRQGYYLPALQKNFEETIEEGDEEEEEMVKNVDF